MDWSKIKTIFILTFLLLDIYLVFQFMNTRNSAKYEFIKEAPLEEKLKNDEITYEELPKVIPKERYVSVKPKVFTEDDIKGPTGSPSILANGTILRVELDKPVKLSSKFDESEFNSSFVKDEVPYGDQYRFWEINEKDKQITYFQYYRNKVLYKNANGQITFYLNDKNELVYYEQTYLEVVEELSEKQEVLPPLRAIETLFNKDLLKPKSEITHIELGYSTLVQITGSQVLAPTWRFVINGEKSLFVNAFEGHVIPLDDEEKQVTE
ncbi:two-component system regulatory protein YycI [Bacillus sp. T33-2]|uniref:two-component system regulatory protein YycI n=1 Tax=Bacillus sp. T33-2 TaxID=2054168 RepID=UPI000C77DDFA|nr:two-component system regulatory protein YycI [Bacillus sp. T33-2]PLR96487.1 hypothetical protein CVD19_10850 [Bacillus sp. T33-2]